MPSQVSVAVVTEDDLAARRIRDALARDAVAVSERVRAPEQLCDRAGEASAIVLAIPGDVARQRAAIRTVTARLASVPCVVIAAVATNGVRKALDAGASAVLLEPDIERALPETVRAVAVNLTVVPQRFRHDATRPPLSHREKETLALVARGLTNREIAAELYLAESTIKTHIASIFGKLGVGSRSEATALVLDPDENLGLSVLQSVGR